MITQTTKLAESLTSPSHAANARNLAMCDDLKDIDALNSDSERRHCCFIMDTLNSKFSLDAALTGPLLRALYVLDATGKTTCT